LSPDGNTLYASNPENVYQWNYDPKSATVTSAPATLVTNMDNGDHATRTLLISKKVDGALLISRGSGDNIDLTALDVNSGHSQIKLFDIKSPSKIYDFDLDGTLIGWGLRNSVGVAEDPVTGAIYSVENSVDDIDREGVDIHENNPGEEMNYHGFLNGTDMGLHGKNYGYPRCFTAWNVSAMPDNGKLGVGVPFAMDQNSTVNDTYCLEETVAPRLTMQAHWAPLELMFNSKGTAAYATSHGSW
jgi:glucose/arabinose dehydrogenase